MWTKTEKHRSVTITEEMKAKEEFNTYMYNYKNQGMYPNSGIDIIWRLNEYQWKFFSDDFSPKWWHFIYKIPRTG